MTCLDDVLFMLCCEEDLITVSSLYISIKPPCLRCVFVFSTFSKLSAVHLLFMQEFDLSSCCHGNLHSAVPWMQTISSHVVLLSSRPCGGVLMEIPLSRNLVKAGRGFCSVLMNYARPRPAVQRCTEPLSGIELVSSLLKPCQNIPPVWLLVPLAASDWSAWPCGD